MNWHNKSIDTILQELSASKDGLNSSTISGRLEEFGLNQLVEKKKKPVWLLFVHQFNDFMILVLMAAAIISGIAGDLTDTIIILIIVLLNAIMGFVQEYKAEKAMDALSQLATPQATVIRDKQPIQISSKEIVPGDLVVLEAGNLVPADMRLLEVHSLRIEESSLTGESIPIDKTIKTLEETDSSLGDRINMAYKGTQVSAGRGVGIVVHTGMKTEIGKIAGMLQTVESQTPLQKRMNEFGKKLSYLILLICIALFAVGLLRGEEPIAMLLVAISLAVAAIPEALPALITIALARGAKRLVAKNALIRKLPAVETLGSVTYICSDKTGTLTQNKMTVVEIIPYNGTDEPKLTTDLLSVCMAINQDVKKSSNGNWIGDPTEIALVEYLHKEEYAGVFDQVNSDYPRVAELPFDSDRKCMTTVHSYEQQFLVVSKGATEAISQRLNNRIDPVEWLKEAGQMAKEGKRVIAYGYKIIDKLPEPFDYENVETDLQPAGLAGMIDPPRDEVKKAIKDCKTAGIQPVMITGDHPETAAAIAREIGLYGNDDLAITGKELALLSPDELDNKVERIKVYARVSPEQKLNIVQSLQRKKHFVAMTGDGVNDAPSLKSANIGVAMGITGTDVSKEAAHMILLDDNFTTIVKAVKEGRRIYDNIRKFVKYIMTCNGAEIWTIFMAPLLGMPIPLLPIHILWINLVTDGLPGLALSAEKAENDIMKRPPRRTDEGLFSEGTGYHIVWVGLLMAVVTLGTQAWAIHTNHPNWQTMVFTVLSLAQLGHVLAIRSDHSFIYKIGLFSNPSLAIAVIGTFFIQLGVIYLPFANKLFKTAPLSLTDLLICIGIAAIIFHAVELEKFIRNRYYRRN
ncbi:cation-translocating P-type ATPase [Flavihumibacter sp. UBA7668]|uniref:cation-translocating P-type ATPase n=1 Tax=Flavihumibacter sp. UBA7668 TaxID=1946542 RepID=UPI0025BD2255|nr:cation-translocating P-type ATPase [Flavihumibacter sp. UBA7668]